MVLKQIQQEAVVKPLFFTSQGTDRDPKGRTNGFSFGALIPRASDASTPLVPEIIHQCSQPGNWIRQCSGLISNQQLLRQKSSPLGGGHNIGNPTVTEPQNATLVHIPLNL